MKPKILNSENVIAYVKFQQKLVKNLRKIKFKKSLKK